MIIIHSPSVSYASSLLIGGLRFLGDLMAYCDVVPPLYTVKQCNATTFNIIRFNRGCGVYISGDREEQLVHEKKLDSAFARAKSMIRQYGLCNPWDYFVTLTLDSNIYDRYDLGKFHKDLMQWVRNERKRYKKIYPDHDKKLSVLFVPENHRDGAWHLHGFVYGLPEGETSRFEAGKHPRELVDGDFRNWLRYSDSFGFCSLGSIRDLTSTVFYTCKYINKNITALADLRGQHLYFASRPLNIAVTSAYAYSYDSELDSYISHEGKFCSTGYVFNSDWTFLTKPNLELVLDGKIENPDWLRPEPSSPDFDPSSIDPSYDYEYFSRLI